MQKLKHLSKYIRLELQTLDLIEFNGDKEAYLLYMVQNELSQNHIAQFGKDRKTILIFEKETVYPMWQGRIPHSFSEFLREGTSLTVVVFHLPKVYLATREKQHIIVKIKKVLPKWRIAKEQLIPKEFFENNKYLLRYDFATKSFEIYEYSQWELVGLRYRSEQ